MKKKWNLLAVCSFVMALAIFIFTYMLFHYYEPGIGFVAVRHEQAAKPFVTFLFGVWGVMFLFSGMMCILISMIFFSERK